MDPIEAARFHLEDALGPEVFTRTVTSVRTLNSVLVVTLAEPPTNLATVDRYWRVCRVLAAEVSVPDIEPGKTALVVIQPNGANVVYALAGETTCKLA